MGAATHGAGSQGAWQYGGQPGAGRRLEVLMTGVQGCDPSPGSPVPVNLPLPPLEGSRGCCSGPEGLRQEEGKLACGFMGLPTSDWGPPGPYNRNT